MSCAARRTADAGRRQGYGRRLAAVSLTGALGLAGLTACGDDSAVGGSDGDVDKLGEQVTVRAEVNEMIGPHAFTVSGTELTSTEELLVVSRKGVELQDESEVEVTGVLREEFDVRAVGEELGYEWKPDPFARWEGEYYVVASKIET